MKLIQSACESSNFEIALCFISELGHDGCYPMEINTEDEYLLRDAVASADLDAAVLLHIADAEALAGVLACGERPQSRLCISFNLVEFLALMRLLAEMFLEHGRADAFSLRADLLASISIEEI